MPRAACRVYSVHSTCASDWRCRRYKYSFFALRTKTEKVVSVRIQCQIQSPPINTAVRLYPRDKDKPVLYYRVRSRLRYGTAVQTDSRVQALPGRRVLNYGIHVVKWLQTEAFQSRYEYTGWYIRARMKYETKVLIHTFIQYSTSPVLNRTSLVYYRYTAETSALNHRKHPSLQTSDDSRERIYRCQLHTLKEFMFF